MIKRVLIVGYGSIGKRHARLARDLFPNAKIIHVKRKLEDNYFSLYKNSFDGNMNWCYDKTDLLNYCQKYLDLMEFWTNKIPNFILDVKYEKNEIQKEAKYLSLNIDKAKKHLNWKPKWNSTIAMNLTLLWYKDYYNGINPNSLIKNEIEKYYNS